MSQFIVFLCSSLCLLIYLPVVMVGFRGITRRQAVFTIRGKRLHFTDAAAILFSGGQILGGLTSIFGIVQAVQNTNLLYIPPFVVLGALISMGGLWAARRTQKGEYEVDLMQEFASTFSQVRVIVRGAPATRTQQPPPAEDAIGDDVITIEAEDVTTIRDSDDDRTNGGDIIISIPDDDKPRP